MPLTNLAGSFGDNLGQIPGVNSIGSAVGFSPSDYAVIRKRFINTSKKPISSGNGVTDLDDPTYLGFQLVFDITSPLFNGATNENSSFTNRSDSANSSVQGSSSAVGYLEKIGEQARAGYLKAFIQGIRQINAKRPYYWQSITGLSEAWTSLASMGPDPYVGSKDGEGITIACLEAVDLKLTGLFSLYKLAVYDSRYKRFILPKNLMYFDVDVKVTEIRQFKKTLNYLGLISNNKLGNNDNAANVIGENASFVKFRFTDCMWQAEECGKVFDSISNAGGEVASTSVKWSYSNIIVDSQFAGYNKELLDSRNQKSTFGNEIVNFAKDQGSQIAQQALQSAAQAAERAVLSEAQGLLFGNIHGGVQNEITNILQNSGAAGVNAAIGGLSGSGNQFNTPPIQLADNILPTPAPLKNSIPTDKIQPAANKPTNFDGADTKPFTPTKVFGAGPSGPPPLESRNIHQ